MLPIFQLQLSSRYLDISFVNKKEYFIMTSLMGSIFYTLILYERVNFRTNLFCYNWVARILCRLCFFIQQKIIKMVSWRLTTNYFA